MKYRVYGVSPSGAIHHGIAQSTDEVSTLANEMLRQGLKDVTSEPLPADPIIIRDPLETGATVNLTANFTATLPDGSQIELPAGTMLREKAPRARTEDEPVGLGAQLVEEAEALAARESIPFDDAFRRVAGFRERS